MSSCSPAGLITEIPLDTGNLIRMRHSEEPTPASELVGSNSSSSHLTTPSPLTLRSRRALNTTPDSSPSPLSKPDRVRSRSPLLASTQTVTESQLPHDSPEPSRTIRQRNHIYYRDEPSEDIPGTDATRPIHDSLLSYQDPNDKLIRHNFVFYAICFIPILLILYCLWSHSSEYPSSSHPSISDPLHTLMGQLSTEFPNQTSRFWAQLRSALEQPYHHVRSHPELPNFDLSNPTVILFVKRQPSSESTIQNGDFNSLFQCFISRFGWLTTSVVFGQEQPRCIVPFEPSMLGTRTDDPLTAMQSEKYKLDIDSKMRHAHDDGIRCFHLPSIDTLPPEVMLLFHGVADAQNSLYKNTLLLFSLGHIFRFDNQSVPFDSALAVEHRLLERQIQRHLRALWTSALGSEETDALLSRLTPTIAVFHPTDSVIPATCKDGDG